MVLLLPVFLVDDDPVREDRIVVEHPEAGQQPGRIADHVRGIREDGFWGGSIVRVDALAAEFFFLRIVLSDGFIIRLDAFSAHFIVRRCKLPYRLEN